MHSTSLYPQLGPIEQKIFIPNSILNLLGKHFVKEPSSMKIKAIFLAVLTATFFFSCKAGKEKTGFQTIYNEKFERLDSLYSELYKYGEFNGNVLVADKGKIIFQRSYGLADEETKRNLNIETAFELASVSKQFTAMGIVQLQKEGELSYEDEISKYIPELASYEGITIKNLLTHTGGLPDYMNLAEENWDKSKIATNEDIIELFQKIEPEKEFEQNEDFAYSNTGYLLLATIIERFSGKSFGEYLNEAIFKPLGMDNTFVYRRRFKPQKVQNYAQGYIYSDSLKRKILPDENGEDFFYVYLDGTVGDGTVSSNLHDLLKWDRSLYENDIINDEDRNLMFSSNYIKDSIDTGFGFGWFVDNDSVYGKIVSHGGKWAGYRTYIERNLDNDKTIIILQNNGTRKIKIPSEFTRKILYGLPVERTVRLQEEILQNYAGTYIEENGVDVELLYRDKSLWVPINSSTEFPLMPISKTKFILKGFRPEVTYEFNLDANGNVDSYRVQQTGTGVDRTAKRKK